MTGSYSGGSVNATHREVGQEGAFGTSAKGEVSFEVTKFNETKTYKVNFDAVIVFEVDEKRGMVSADKLGSRCTIS